MSTPNPEIAAAAERLRRVQNAEGVPEYDAKQNLIGGVLCRDYLSDLITLAAAYLAEHADDGEAVTLLKRAHYAAYKDGWQQGDTVREVAEDINEYLMEREGPLWVRWPLKGADNGS